MSIDATLAVTAPPLLLLRLEMLLISKTTAAKSNAAGYFNYRSLLEMRIRQGQVDMPKAFLDKQRCVCNCGARPSITTFQ